MSKKKNKKILKKHNFIHTGKAETITKVSEITLNPKVVEVAKEMNHTKKDLRSFSGIAFILLAVVVGFYLLSYKVDILDLIIQKAGFIKL